MEPSPEFNRKLKKLGKKLKIELDKIKVTELIKVDPKYLPRHIK